LALITVSATFAQETPKTVTVKGTVFNEFGSALFTNLFVVNKRTRQGNFANPSGDFEIKIRKDDTVLVGSNGYETYRICVKDSVDKPVYEIEVKLKPLRIQLQQVEVFAERDIEQIYKDIEKLGYNPKDFKVATGVSALSSPITSLYAAFSRREQQRLLAYELMNDAKKRELLKELFVKYVDADIIDLSDNEFDDFIDFCDVSDEFLKTSTQYEFIEYIKTKYRLYEEVTKYDDYYRGE
jgi:hypothetical protein